jgi:hemerythrin-like metal-binding protein
MTYMEWHSALEVGHERIDADHRALVGALNQLHAAMDQGKDQAEIVKVLNFLRDYTVTHFQAEETLMIQHNYPGAPAHFAVHAELVLKVSDFIGDYRSGKTMLTADLLAFLESWLLEHILGLDKELSGFLRNRGAKG